MHSHLEQKADEIYLGNSPSGIPAHLQNLKTIRLGNVAYDVHGKRMDHPRDSRHKPLFLGRSDELRHDRIMRDRK